MTQNSNSVAAAPERRNSERIRVLRWPEVQKLTGLCRSHAYSMARKGKFPSPIKLGGRASGWIESEVYDWIEDRVSESRHLDSEAQGA